MLLRKAFFCRARRACYSRLRVWLCLALLLSVIGTSLLRKYFIIAALQEGTSEALVLSPCASRISCLDCSRAPHCCWCASTETCIDNSKEHESTCDSGDEECGYCSPILLPVSTAAAHPSRHTFRVIYVGRKTGGPEALVQLYLALRRWGWNASLETRKKQVGKRMHPFFLEAYSNEFRSLGLRMRWSEDYRSFIKSGRFGDVLVLTETWPCVAGVRYLPAVAPTIPTSVGSVLGVRQLQYQLTVQNRNLTYDISHMYVEKANPVECSTFAHTHYIAREFLQISPFAIDLLK